MPTTATPPPLLDDLPATPDRADRATFATRCTALFDQLKNSSIGQWRAALAWMNAATADAAKSVMQAADQATLAGQRADAAAGSAANAANTLAAVQSALGARKWAPGPYAEGTCVWSPSNGQAYRARAALANSTVDPASDPANWFALALQSLPIAYVNDSGGSLYGSANGGLNTINVIQYSAGPCAKHLPAEPSDGDVCIWVVANGLTNNSAWVINNKPIVVGSTVVTDYLVLDQIGLPITFKYFSALNHWRVI